MVNSKGFFFWMSAVVSGNLNSHFVVARLKLFINGF